MAVKFYLPDSTTTDIVALSLPAFFARTPEDLLAFNDARRVEPETGQPDMERVGTYLAEHPEAMAAVTAAITHPIPASYATLTYNSLHMFGFVNAQGAVRYGRYRLVPEQGEESLSDEEAAAALPTSSATSWPSASRGARRFFTCGPSSPMGTIRSTTPRQSGPWIARSSTSRVWR